MQPAEKAPLVGPTEDDLTKEVCAEVMGLPLSEDPHSRKRIERYMKEYKKNHPDRRVTSNNYKQAQCIFGRWIGRSGVSGCSGRPGTCRNKGDAGIHQ